MIVEDGPYIVVPVLGGELIFTLVAVNRKKVNRLAMNSLKR